MAFKHVFISWSFEYPLLFGVWVICLLFHWVVWLFIAHLSFKFHFYLQVLKIFWNKLLFPSEPEILIRKNWPPLLSLAIFSQCRASATLCIVLYQVFISFCVYFIASLRNIIKQFREKCFLRENSANANIFSKEQFFLKWK